MRIPNSASVHRWWDQVCIKDNVRFFLHRFLISASVVVLSSVFLFGADLQAGKRAYEQKDYVTATKELAPLAQQGNAEAELLLGRMYMSGQGVPKDRDLALKWFRAAADQGNAEGQFFLGAMYLLPAKDISQGLKWLRLSAEQGMPDAQLLLGMAYLKGRDAPHDLVEADMWLQLAANQGDKFAPSQRELAEKQMSPDQIAKARALAAAWKPPTSPSSRNQEKK
jgi:TPR repeat protein